MQKIILHPFLLMLYSILSLYATNVELVAVSNTIRLLLLCLFSVTALLLFLRLILQDWHRAGLACSLVVVLFISFGHVYNFLVVYLIQRSIYLPADVLIAIWAAVLILGIWWVIRKIKKPGLMTRYLNIISIALILFPLSQIAIFQFQSTGKMGGQSIIVVPPGEAQSINSPETLPDIYYIILDEYGRSDALQEILNYDNSEFVEYLHTKGFYVADGSTTNYAITLQSLASSLNSEYLDAYTSADPKDSATNSHQLTEMVRHNRALSTLKNAGYHFVSLASGYSYTEFKDADFYYSPSNYITDFELEYLRSTALTIGFDSFQASRSRALITNAFDRLASLPKIATDRPKFVIAHIMAGHVPFVFGPNGEETPLWAFSINPDDDRYEGRTYVSAYIDQLSFINQKVETAVDAILSKSKIPPIIIIQGDHGPESRLDWLSVENTCLKERMSILNAYYLPGAGQDNLYPSITPVNSFRIVFRHYLGINIELLEDRSYFSKWNQSYQFLDVTERLNSCN